MRFYLSQKNRLESPRPICSQMLLALLIWPQKGRGQHSDRVLIARSSDGFRSGWRFLSGFLGV
ncbi:Uncharacterised protein [Vibrio cholerae]|nr:Uncharacterised protein [Vibrio cholerae]